MTDDPLFLFSFSSFSKSVEVIYKDPFTFHAVFRVFSPGGQGDFVVLKGGKVVIGVVVAEIKNALLIKVSFYITLLTGHKFINKYNVVKN